MTKKTIIIQILITLISLSGCNMKPTSPSKEAEKPPEQTGGGSAADGSATTARNPLRSPASPSTASKPTKPPKTEAERTRQKEENEERPPQREREQAQRDRRNEQEPQEWPEKNRLKAEQERINQKKALAKTCSEISDEATCSKNTDCKFYIVCMPADKASEIENDKELKAKLEEAEKKAKLRIYQTIKNLSRELKSGVGEIPLKERYEKLEIEVAKFNELPFGVVPDRLSIGLDLIKKRDEALQNLKAKMGKNNQKDREANEKREQLEREKLAKKNREAEEQRKRENQEEEKNELLAKQQRAKEQAERDRKNEQERQKWLENNRLKTEQEKREEQERKRLDLEKKQQEETERRQREEQERKQHLAQQQKQILEKKEKKEQERKKLEEIDREREEERERNRIAEEENKKQRAEQGRIDSIKRDNQYVMKESLKRRLDPFSLTILDALLEKSNNLVHRDDLASVIVEDIHRNQRFSSDYYIKKEQKEIYQKGIGSLKQGLRRILMQEIEKDNKGKAIKGDSVFISGIYNNIFQKKLFIDVVEILTLSDESLISYIKNKTNNTEKENLKSLTTEYGLKSEEKNQLKAILTSAGIIN